MVIWGTGRPPAHDAFVPTHRVLERGDMFANEVEGKWMGYSAQRVQPAFLGEVAPGYLEAMDNEGRGAIWPDLNERTPYVVVNLQR